MAKKRKRRLGSATIRQIKTDGQWRNNIVELWEGQGMIYLDHLSGGGAIDTIGINDGLITAVRAAVRLYIDIYRPRGVEKVVRSGSWLSDGINIKRKKHERALIVGDKIHRGENHFHCLFCGDNILTFGWNDGVGSVPAKLCKRMRTHTYWCAMQFVRRFHEGNDDGYQLAYHPDPDRGRPLGTTRRMLELKLYSDRQELAEQLNTRMPIDESLKFDPNAEGRNS